MNDEKAIQLLWSDSTEDKQIGFELLWAKYKSMEEINRILERTNLRFFTYGAVSDTPILIYKTACGGEKLTILTKPEI